MDILRAVTRASNYLPREDSMQGMRPGIPSLCDRICVALPIDAGRVGDLVAIAAQLPEFKHGCHWRLYCTQQGIWLELILCPPEADPEGQQPAVPAQNADCLVPCRQ